MLIEFLNGIICGFGIIIATFFGVDDEKKMQKAVGGSIVLGVAATLAISLCSLFFLPQILGILHVSEELMPQSASYIRIILAGLIATALYNICAAGNRGFLYTTDVSGDFQSFKYFVGLFVCCAVWSGSFRGGLCDGILTGVVGGLVFLLYEKEISTA